MNPPTSKIFLIGGMYPPSMSTSSLKILYLPRTSSSASMPNSFLAGSFSNMSVPSLSAIHVLIGLWSTSARNASGRSLLGTRLIFRLRCFLAWAT